MISSFESVFAGRPQIIYHRPNLKNPHAVADSSSDATKSVHSVKTNCILVCFRFYTPRFYLVLTHATL